MAYRKERLGKVAYNKEAIVGTSEQEEEQGRGRCGERGVRVSSRMRNMSAPSCLLFSLRGTGNTVLFSVSGIYWA